MPEYFTPAEVAKKLGTTEVSVRRWITQGKLPGFKIGGRVFIPKNFEETLAAKKQSEQPVPDGKPPAA